MDITITYADGMVRIQNIGYTTSSDQIDISAAPGEFVMEVSRAIPSNPALDSMTIWHQSGRRVCSFAAHEISIPAGADIDALIPLVDAILTQSSGGGTTVTPKNTIYVSGVQGSPTGNGSIADPINTIADGVALAEAAGIADGLAWTVHVLAGVYDEQIIQSALANNVYITLGSGVNVSFSGIGATVADTNHSMYINMEQGSNMENVGGGSVISGAANNTTVFGSGTITMQSPYPVIESVNPASEINIVGITLLNLAGGPTEMINMTDGTIRLTNVAMIQVPAQEPIVKDGGSLKLTNVAIYAPTATNYATTSGVESIQVVNGVSNLASGAGITETVGTMLVDASFAI
jgi:hypothetical protein